jgi:hypothetical protein
MSIVLKNAVLPGSRATMPLSQLFVSLQLPPAVLVQVPSVAVAVSAAIASKPRASTV